ncbi:hypothetical protein ANN_05321 [Periplaneta americana]|uniref:Uncharacterized protein n=1 Tax=Periplaneta americana TaxID=6978 RepID=A0ABQ8TC41_PERAM|nr:hypothetical protein ANN_05321 [Periplaneta americana]
MASLCEGGNELPGSLKAKHEFYQLKPGSDGACFCDGFQGGCADGSPACSLAGSNALWWLLGWLACWISRVLLRYARTTRVKCGGAPSQVPSNRKGHILYEQWYCVLKDLKVSCSVHLLTQFTVLRRTQAHRQQHERTTGVAQSVKALACRSEVALGRGFDPRLGGLHSWVFPRFSPTVSEGVRDSGRGLHRGDPAGGVVRFRGPQRRHSRVAGVYPRIWGEGSNHHPESSSPGSLILFERTDEKSYKPWTGVIQKFLEGYNNSAENVVQCGYDKPPYAGQVCEVKMDEFGNCNKENDFGYPEGKPCVFLKFNKVTTHYLLHVSISLQLNVC